MMNNLERLVELLSSIPPENFRECEEEYGLFAFGELANEADELASELFTTTNGQPNYEAMIEFYKLYDFVITAGETDSFGWLTGVIWYPDNKHCLVFG